MTARRGILLAFATVAMSTSASWCIWRGTIGVPIAPLDVTPAEVDLGTVLLGDSAQFEVKMRNRGRETLEIGAVRPGCSCANVRTDRNRLEPGEEATLTGTFRGTGRVGAFRQAILVVLAAPEGEHFVIPVAGTAKSRIGRSPDALTLRPDFTAGKPGTGAFVVRNQSSKAINIERPRSLPAGLALILERTALAPDESGTVSLTADPNVVVPSSETLRLGCSHPVEKYVELPVQIAPEKPVSIDPPGIPLGVLPKRDFLARKTISVSFEGQLLAGCDIGPPKAPPYLSSAALRETSSTRRVYDFHIVDNFHGSDLGGKITLALRYRATGRSVTLETPISGFLMDAVTR